MVKPLSALKTRRRVKCVVAVIAVSLTPLYIGAMAIGASAAGTSYYVSCSSGSDSNSGASADAAWKSLAAVSRHNFTAGSNILLADGCSFDGGVTINGTATSSDRIVVSSYGSGSAPNVSDSSGTQFQNAIEVQSPYTTVENLLVTNAKQAGVGLDGAFDIAQNLEVTNSGEGVEAEGGGHNSLITHVNAHDLRMVVNNPGGNNDYGATGFNIGTTDVEVADNVCINCKAPSDDYGTDGGFVEIFDSGDNLYVHGNRANNVDGFTEIGGGSGETSANNMRFDNNIIENAGALVNVHSNDVFGIPVSNLSFDNNTVYQPSGSTQLFFSAASVSARNNIFDVPGGASFASAPGVHTNNLFSVGGSNSLGAALGSGEKMGDPMFVNAAGGNFALQSASPARGMGAAIGDGPDYTGKALNSPPDAGALQFGSSSATFPTAPITSDSTTTMAPTAGSTSTTQLSNGAAPSIYQCRD